MRITRDEAVGAAEDRYHRQSLIEWPQDALALRVLAEAEAALGQKDAARKHAAEVINSSIER